MDLDAEGFDFLRNREPPIGLPVTSSTPCDYCRDIDQACVLLWGGWSCENCFENRQACRRSSCVVSSQQEVSRHTARASIPPSVLQGATATAAPTVSFSPQSWTGLAENIDSRQSRCHRVLSAEAPDDLGERLDKPKLAERLAQVPVNKQDGLDRWRRSPTRLESACRTAISNLPGTFKVAKGDETSQLPVAFLNEERDLRKTSSYVVIESPLSADDDAACPSTSKLSSYSLVTRNAQDPPASTAALEDQASSPRGNTIFPCTFCTKRFRKKWDWKRHEASVHLRLRRWACPPQDGSVESNEGSICIYCGADDSSLNHLRTHNHQACQEGDVLQHIFFRKDKLQDHLGRKHPSSGTPAFGSWEILTPNLRSRCGFCNHSCSTLDERANHLADHFHEGLQMADWEGDSGFEQSVQDQIQNVTRPWGRR